MVIGSGRTNCISFWVMLRLSVATITSIMLRVAFPCVLCFCCYLCQLLMKLNIIDANFCYIWDVFFPVEVP